MTFASGEMSENRKVKVGVACHKQTKRWHIIAVRDGEATVYDDLSFATEAEARDELDRLIHTLGPLYTVNRMQ